MDITVWTECYATLAPILSSTFPDKAPHFFAYLRTVRVKKNFTCPFRLTDRSFPLYFLSQERPHPFNIRLISACVLSPFVRKNGRFGARFSARVNCLSVDRTARELDTKRRILFFHAKGYRAPTITMRADDETTVQEVLGRRSRHQRDAR